MNGLKENGIRKARDFQWGRGIDALEEFFGSISAKARAMAHGNSHREETPSYRERGSIFFICNKDPFSDYRDWLKVDETMKCFSDSRFVVEALLFVDAHPNKSVRARMGMLAPTAGAHRFRWRSFYHRRMKFKLDFLNRSIFLASAIFQLCAGVLLFRKRYAGVVFAEGTSPTLQFVCTLLRVPFHSIRLNNPRLKGYSFHLYTRDYALKEEGFRGLVREMLVASIDMRAFSHNLHDG
jgi:hypothetical protein